MLLTRAPVAGGGAQGTSPLPLDLHVLSLPLAFILSQDQTLRCYYFDIFYIFQCVCPWPLLHILYGCLTETTSSPLSRCSDIPPASPRVNPRDRLRGRPVLWHHVIVLCRRLQSGAFTLRRFRQRLQNYLKTHPVAKSLHPGGPQRKHRTDLWGCVSTELKNVKKCRMGLNKQIGWSNIESTY